ncbi:MAG TPA: TetR/AcrR family transcriptional regulator [Nevskiaceae bacterium]|nr:TetR/AcrR family transcriptional regulator [Nevskiaceae bacterium]
MAPTKPLPRRRPAARRRQGDSGSWQAEKSENTRTQIVDATLRCLVKLGYAQTTTERIAEEAGVSRGAMTHHFRSRAAVFEAAASYITEKRAEEFEEKIRDFHYEPGEVPTLGDMQRTMMLMQRYYAEPTFVAFHELLRGARTDKTLKKMLVPLEEALDRRIAESMLRRMPYWSRIEGTREVLTDLVHFTLQGVAINNPAQYVGGDRLQHLLDMLAVTAYRTFVEAYAGEKPGKAPR